MICFESYLLFWYKKWRIWLFPLPICNVLTDEICRRKIIFAVLCSRTNVEYQNRTSAIKDCWAKFVDHLKNRTTIVLYVPKSTFIVTFAKVLIRDNLLDQQPYLTMIASIDQTPGYHVIFCNIVDLAVFNAFALWKHCSTPPNLPHSNSIRAHTAQHATRKCQLCATHNSKNTKAKQCTIDAKYVTRNILMTVLWTIVFDFHFDSYFSYKL